MALVGNKADLHEKREVLTDVSFCINLASIEHFVTTFTVLASSSASVYDILSSFNRMVWSLQRRMACSLLTRQPRQQIT